MLQTVEAVLQPDGALKFLEPVHVASAQRVLVTLTEPLDEARNTTLASEAALAKDWLRDEEEAAWAHLQPVAGKQAPQP
jgi:hypothetical protein